MPGRAALLSAHGRELVELAAVLVGDEELAPQVVERAVGGLWPRRDPVRLRDAALQAVVRTARRTRSPWTRRDPLADVPAAEREVLGLRAVCGLPVPAVAHLLDAPLGTTVAREAAGLAAASCADLDDLRALLRPWLDEVVRLPSAPAGRGGTTRSGAGLAAVAAVALLGVLAVDALPAPEPPGSRRPVVQREEPDEPEPVLPSPGATGCAGSDALCTSATRAPALPPPEGVDTRVGTPFWPFTTDRQAADWAVDPGGRPWAGDPVAVAHRLAADLLGLRGARARSVGGGLVTLRLAGGAEAAVRLVRLGRGEARPWSVVAVTSAAVELERRPTLAPGQAAGGSARGPVDVRLLDPSGRTLATADRLDAPLQPPDDWSVAALVAVRRDGSGLALQPVRREGSVRGGVPAAGSTFLAEVDGSVRLHDALSGEQLLQVSSPSSGARDSDPSRGGRDGVLFVRTEADGCTTSVLRAALDRGAGGTTVQRGPVVRRLPRLSPSGGWTGWVEAPCEGGPGALVLRGPDARQQRVPLGSRAVSALDVRDDGSAVLQLRGPDRVVDLPAGAAALPAPLAVPPGCTATAAAAARDGVVLWERCGASSTPVLRTAQGRRVLGRPAEAVQQTAVVQAEEGPLVLVLTTRGAVSRLAAGRLVPVVPPCLRAPGCVVSLDW